MKYRILILRRASNDLRSIARWLEQRSPQGANAWLDAFEQMAIQLAERADSFPAAMESSAFAIPLKQALFRTRRGRPYRAIFTIVADEVRILRIRGPGQPPLADDEMS